MHVTDGKRALSRTGFSREGVKCHTANMRVNALKMTGQARAATSRAWPSFQLMLLNRRQTGQSTRDVGHVCVAAVMHLER